MSEQNGHPTNECCDDPGNLEQQPNDRDDLVIRQCRVCGRRHFEAFAEPLDMRIETT